jgi:hypothetical protein
MRSLCLKNYYWVRSIMLVLIIALASSEILYSCKTLLGSLISKFLNSGSLAALSKISLIISASFCLESKYPHKQKRSIYS